MQLLTPHHNYHVLPRVADIVDGGNECSTDFHGLHDFFVHTSADTQYNTCNWLHHNCQVLPALANIVDPEDDYKKCIVTCRQGHETLSKSSYRYHEKLWSRGQYLT